jgi:magnesium-transporting ATPase (P-type)
MALQASQGLHSASNADSASGAVGAWAAPLGTQSPGQGHHIIKRFEFSSQLQRNTVVVRLPALPNGEAGGTAVFVKGSPEMLRTMVAPESMPQGGWVGCNISVLFTTKRRMCVVSFHGLPSALGDDHVYVASGLVLIVYHSHRN